MIARGSRDGENPKTFEKLKVERDGKNPKNFQKLKVERDIKQDMGLLAPQSI